MTRFFTPPIAIPWRELGRSALRAWAKGRARPATTPPSEQSARRIAA